MLIFLGLVLASVMVQAQDDQSGFISIDCGTTAGLAYTDKATGINYVSDAEFIQSGEIYTIPPTNYKDEDNVLLQLTTLRSFPENIRNCYTLRPAQGKGNKYLIRALFMYGNYDSKNKIPSFDIFLGADYWSTVKLTSPLHQIYREIIHVPLSDYIHVCLVDTGNGNPFVSAIELRPLTLSMYDRTDLGSLQTFVHADFGSTSLVRYKADKYDRLWRPIPVNNATSISAANYVNVTDATAKSFPPSEVMSTAVTIDSFSITWTPVNSSDQFLMYIHFAEIELLKSNQTREFNIYLNDKFWYGPFVPPNYTAYTLVSGGPELIAPNYILKINRTENSTLPILINALDIFVLKKIPEIRQTDDADAAAILGIKSNYKVTRNWQGDPCAPKEYVWNGLGCRYFETNTSSRITVLNLTTSRLSGEIDPAIANLTLLETLDLSNNNLTGTVPDFLSELKFLKVLNIKGNKFTGSVPEKLLAKSREGSLLMSIDGVDTRSSCGTKGCKNKKGSKMIVPVVATVAILVIVATVLTTFCIVKKQKSRAKKKTGTVLEIKKQKFTYSEVRSITDNFKFVIGKGGFGTVYHGHMDDTEVAVKMLSESSLQGDSEFQTEANLLLSVHHKNITSLVGFCDEGNHKGIIYEYMAHGNLEMRLFDTNSRVLNWEERLQIGCDAAHGLEYLHHGCKPPIVHRDVKCTNILLNGTCHAKLADFGLSKAFTTEGGTHISTKVAGTPGYLDPEYHISGRLTEKSDVYSFGVVLLVIITGQRAIQKDDNEFIHISQWVKLKFSDGEIENIVDPRILGDFDINSAWKVVELAMACVVSHPNKRPTIKEAVIDLSDCLAMEGARKKTKPRGSAELSSLTMESNAYGPNPR